jgi:multisubunit Na+/H+ antiporter MnhB subunit
MTFDFLSGIVMTGGGIWLALLAYRVIPVNRKDPERAELWHRQFGVMAKIASPIMIIFGILQLLGVV